MSLDAQVKSCQVVIKSYAKINLFLKIVGKTQISNVTYHLLHSRFMKVYGLFDVLGFNFDSEKFNIVGNFNCIFKENTIYRAFLALIPYISRAQAEMLERTQVIVQKRIPSGGGLGGGSSNAACFLQVVNRELNLGLSKEKLMEIGASIGSDVPFFLSDLEIANVEGRGEVVTPYDKESQFDVDIISPNVHCSTKEVFAIYAREFYDLKDTLQTKEENWLKKSNAEILNNDAFANNDLFKPLLKLHPELESYYQKDLFLSGSGSCFWKHKASKINKVGKC